MLTPIQRFWKLLRQYPVQLRHIYTYAVLNGLVNLSLPLGIQAIITYLQTGETSSSWFVLVGLVLFGVAASGIFQVLQLRIVENIQQDIFVRSGLEFAYRLPQIKHQQLDKVHAPELMNRFFDTQNIQKGLPKILIDFSLASFQIFFGLILLTIYSPFFVLLAMALFIIMFLLVRTTGPRGLESSLKESKHKYRLAHWLEEVARVNVSFKMHEEGRLHLHKTDDVTVDYIKARENHFSVLMRQFVLFVSFKVIVAAGLLLLGGILVFQEQMSIGQFVAAEIVILLIINSVEKVIRVIETIYDVLTALEKIGYVLDMDLEDRDGQVSLLPQDGLSIKAREITFSFPDSRNAIINRVSFTVPSRSRTIIQGPPGSGKTTLLRLIMGIHEPEEGELYINDVPVRSYDRDQLHRHIGIVLSTNELFEGTVRENITMGEPVDEQYLNEVIRMLELEDFIVQQPGGVDCMIDSGGRRLPRSIIQKLQIARAIVQRPKLLLLEDPLASVEENIKRRIIDYLMDENKPWTIMVVADYDYWREQCTQRITLEK